MWRIDSEGNAYNKLGTIIAPFEKTINGRTMFEIYLWFPQYNLYDELAVVDSLGEARAFIKGYAEGYNDKLNEED